MTRSSLAVEAQRALASRLRSVAPILLHPLAVPERCPDPAADAAEVFEQIVSAVERDAGADRIWLLLTAMSAVYPTRSEVDSTRRRFELESSIDLRMQLLDGSLEKVRAMGTATTEIEVLVGAVVVDVDHSAKHDLHTGIQRVSRNLLPLWDTDRDIVPAAWSGTTTALRRLTRDESNRVIRWVERDAAKMTATETGAKKHDTWADPTDEPSTDESSTEESSTEEWVDDEPSTDDPSSQEWSAEDAGTARTNAHAPRERMVVPWRSVVVMVEVPPPDANDRLAAVGSVSGNKLVGIAYDAIPVVSADAVPPVESMKFARYLTAVKFATRMAGISAAATAEIGGFVRMLPTQGLVGPAVTEVSLPATDRATGRQPTGRRAPGVVPTVLSVGSHEPRKNHLAILYAAEVLWRTGLRFSLEFIGGSGWGDDFPRRAADLKAAGRPVLVRKSISDAELHQAFSTALFTVFPSLHEGYGLPVAESMAHGTPVITSNFGSMAEIAADGGALTIDPRDDDALTEAMRTLLTEPAEVARLTKEIANRPRRGWADYAAELWDAIVEPELAVLAPPRSLEPAREGA